MADQVPSLVQGIALGIGSVAPSVNDQRLGFEIARVPVLLRSYDPVADKIIFKAQVPDEFIGKISEAGLVSLLTDALTDNTSQTLSTFDQFEGWEVTAGSILWNSTNTRLGEDSMRMALATSSSATAVLPVALDLSRHSPVDTVTLAYNASTTTSGITITFLTDLSNYFYKTITPVVGYQTASIAKASFTANGVPNWGNITQIKISVAATTGGSTVVDLDGLAIFDEDNLNPDSILVAREVFTPIEKATSSVNEIEFSLTVNAV